MQRRRSASDTLPFLALKWPAFDALGFWRMYPLELAIDELCSEGYTHAEASEAINHNLKIVPIWLQLVDGTRLETTEYLVPLIEKLQVADSNPKTDEWLTLPEILDRFGLRDKKDAVRKRLERWRKTHDKDFRELQNQRSNESRYMYRVAAIRRLLGTPTSE